jgi:hypothetical protein
MVRSFDRFIEVLSSVSILFTFSAFSPGFACAEGFTFLNGPSVGLISPPEEGPGEDLPVNLDNMVAGSAELALGYGPLFVYAGGGYGADGGYRYVVTNHATDIDYERIRGEALFCYRLSKIETVSIYYGGRLSYDRAGRNRYSDGTFPDWDEGGAAHAEIRDDGNVGELNLSVGPGFTFRSTERFFLFGYAGLGYGRVHQTGKWTMKWYPPSAPREDKASYDETKSGVSFAGTVLSRIQVSSWFGIGGGVTVTTWPNPTGYLYIPESHFRYWSWGTVNVALWVGPSFDL